MVHKREVVLENSVLQEAMLDAARVRVTVT